MPYINEARRKQLRSKSLPAETPGELSFVISDDIERYLNKRRSVAGEAKSADVMEPLASLEASKLEYVRIVLAPFEDRKRRDNGFVHSPR